MFDLSWHAVLVNFVTALVLGAGWTLGCWLMGRFIAFLTSSNAPAPKTGG